jgi:hypothetical protein
LDLVLEISAPHLSWRTGPGCPAMAAGRIVELGHVTGDDLAECL